MNGHVLTEILTDRRCEIASVELSLGRHCEESYFSEDEEQQIKEKLEGWGYL